MLLLFVVRVLVVRSIIEKETTPFNEKEKPILVFRVFYIYVLFGAKQFANLIISIESDLCTGHTTPKFDRLLQGSTTFA